MSTSAFSVVAVLVEEEDGLRVEDLDEMFLVSENLGSVREKAAVLAVRSAMSLLLLFVVDLGLVFDFDLSSLFEER